MISVLYVDDEPDLLDIGKLFLEQSGQFQVDTAISATDALTTMQSKVYDAIISDYQMPGMDGIELLRKVRASGSTIPFIIFTGRGREEIVIQALNEGADLYIQKGGDPEAQFVELAQKVRLAVSVKQVSAALEKSEFHRNSIIRVAPVGIGVSKDRTILSFNDRFSQITGYAAEELIGKPARILYVTQEDYDYVGHEIFDKVSSEGDRSVETRWKKKDGTIIDVFFTATRIDPSDISAGVIFTALDITERKRAEEALLASRDSLIRSESDIRVHQTELEAQAEELKRTHLELEESRDKYLDLYEFAPLGYLTLTDKEQVADVNLTAATLLAVNRNKLLMAQFSKFVAENEGDQWHRFFLQILGQPEKQSCTITLKRMDGSTFPARLEGVRISDRNRGNPTIRLAISDISDIRNAIEALHESEETFRVHIENSFDVIFTLDSNGRFIFISPAWERHFGIPVGEVLGKSFELFVHPDDIAILHEYLVRVLATGQSEASPAYRVRHADSRWLWFIANGTPYVNTKGERQFVGVARDITEQRQVEAELIKSNKRFHSILNQASDAIILRDKTGHIVEANQKTCSSLGYTRDELLAMKVEDFDPKAIQNGKSGLGLEKVLHDESFTFESVQVRKDGSSFPVEVTLGPIVLDDEVLVMAVARDITERKQAEEALMRKNEELNGAYEQLSAGEEELRQNYEELALSQRALEESEEKYRTMFKMAADGIVVHDTKGRNIDVNEQACKMLGYSHEEMLEMRISDLIQPDEVQKNPPRLAEALAGQPVCYERKLRRKDGTVLDVEIRASRVKEGIVQAFWRDITERKRLEEKRKESEQVHLTVLQTAMDGFVMLDAQGNLLEANEAYCLMSGYNVQELLSMNINDLEATESAEATASHIQRIIQAGQDRFQSKHQRKDGSTYDIESSVQYKPDYGGRFIVFIRDITREKQAEEALHLANEQFQAAMAAGKLAWWIMDCKTGNVTFHENKTRMLGYSPGPFKNYTDFTNKLHPDDYEPAMQAMRDHLRGVKPRYDIEYRIIDANGKYHWFRDVGGISKTDSNGDPRIVTGIVIDITERKRAEVAVKESEAKYRALFEAESDGIFVVDKATGDIIDCNDAITGIYGYQKDELIGKPNTTVSAEPEKTSAATANPYQPIPIRYHRKKDGTIFPVEITANVISLNNRDVIIAAVRDITERMIAEEALHLANKKLNLLTSVSRHDINNQLTVLQGYLKILGKNPSDPVQKDYLQKANASAQRILSMVHFTKEYEEIGIHSPAWQDCRALVEIAAKEAPIGNIKVNNDFPASTEIFADPLIVKVCYNLIDNAVRYGGKITTIRFSVEERDGDHVIVCEDDGDGIPSEDKEKIFERGFGKNTGLGLFLAREILAITSITIKETGTPGKGARFEMTVPKRMYRVSS